jgi:hypothetical protein
MAHRGVEKLISNFSIPVDTLNESAVFSANVSNELPAFPLVAVGKGSYIVDAQIQSTINFDAHSGVHNIQIGNYCSLADSITFTSRTNFQLH